MTLNEGDLVPFVGAGVSMADPTCLPSAVDLASQLVERGYGKDGDDLEEVAEWCWEQGGWLMFAQALPSAEWRAKKPNDCHLVLAELAAERLVREMLTTNWDTMLEVALNRCGVPYTHIAAPVDLALAGADVQVIKLHGCIDTPETIRARRSDVDGEDWAADWAAAVFAVQLRSKSVLFAGYTGASRATTRTVERISAEASRSRLDWMVGRKPFDEVITRERTARLLEALGADQGGYVQMDPLDFFRHLRLQIYPLLLTRPRQQAAAMIRSLLEPTDVTEGDVLGALRLVADAWKDAGQPAAQSALRLAVVSAPSSYYVPIVPNAVEIGQYWAWIAMVTWAGAGQFNASSLLAEAEGIDARRIPVVPILCRPTEARGRAAAAALTKLASSSPSPSLTCIGVVVGGAGPISAPETPYSVARGTPSPDVVRGGFVKVEWTKAEVVFDLAEPNVPSDQISSAIRFHITELTTASEAAP